MLVIVWLDVASISGSRWESGPTSPERIWKAGGGEGVEPSCQEAGAALQHGGVRVGRASFLPPLTVTEASVVTLIGFSRETQRERESRQLV